jgi:hypothetical protein
MNVAGLQKFVSGLQDALEASGAKTVARDLGRLSAGLEPFTALTLGQFADFLRQADEYQRTGVVTAGKRTKARRVKAASPDPAAVQAAAQQMRELYQRAVEPEVTYGKIDAEVRGLNSRFKKADVIAIAKEMGITGASTKKAAIEEIHRKIRERKESYQRTQF